MGPVQQGNGLCAGITAEQPASLDSTDKADVIYPKPFPFTEGVTDLAGDDFLLYYAISMLDTRSQLRAKGKFHQDCMFPVHSEFLLPQQHSIAGKRGHLRNDRMDQVPRLLTLKREKPHDCPEFGRTAMLAYDHLHRQQHRIVGTVMVKEGSRMWSSRSLSDTSGWR
jgi:hypothetical protein